MVIGAIKSLVNRTRLIMNNSKTTTAVKVMTITYIRDCTVCGPSANARGMKTHAPRSGITKRLEGVAKK